LGEFRGHIGVGAALVLETMVVLAEVEEIWVEAAAPVRARTTTKARTMFFMMTTSKVVFLSADFSGQIQ
jgi:hypothetical protein